MKSPRLELIVNFSDEGFVHEGFAHEDEQAYDAYQAPEAGGGYEHHEPVGSPAAYALEPDDGTAYEQPTWDQEPSPEANYDAQAHQPYPDDAAPPLAQPYWYQGQPLPAADYYDDAVDDERCRDQLGAYAGQGAAELIQSDGHLAARARDYTTAPATASP